MAVPSNGKPETAHPKGNLPATPAERAKRNLRAQIALVVLLLLLLIAALAFVFIRYVLPMAKPISDDSLLLKAEYVKQQGIGTTLSASLKEAQDTSGNRSDPALSKLIIGRADPFNDLRPDPPPVEPEWPNIRYAGIIRTGSKTYAIVEVEGSTYSARPGEKVAGKLTVSKINESKLTLSYEGFQREFSLGGESN